MMGDYILIVLVLITVGLSLLLWKYPQRVRGDGEFHFTFPETFPDIYPEIPPAVPVTDITNFMTHNQVNLPAGSRFNSDQGLTAVINTGIQAQITAQQYATAATNYQQMLQNLPNTSANIQKIKAAQKTKDDAYAKAQSVRKDFYKQRDTLNAFQQKVVKQRLSKPPPKTK